MRAAIAILSACLWMLAAAESARALEELQLAPSYRAGDAYQLVLRSSSNTRASSRGRFGRHFRDDVRLEYRARVIVLDTRGGLPVLEHHEQVELRFERPGDSGSLFREGTAFDVYRDEQGEVEIRIGSHRAPEIEQVVAELLEGQLEQSVAARLFQPRRGVAMDEPWPLDPGLLGLFLREQGIESFELGGEATAVLRRVAAEDFSGHAIDYRIPLDCVETGGMPEDSMPSEDSTAELRGSILVPEDPTQRPIVFSSGAELRVSGASVTGNVVYTQPWSVVRSQRSDQQLLRLPRPSLARAVPAAPAR